MRAVLNTYLSLCACVMASFASSALFSPERKFSMEHIQNATLAGTEIYSQAEKSRKVLNTSKKK